MDFTYGKGKKNLSIVTYENNPYVTRFYIWKKLYVKFICNA